MTTVSFRIFKINDRIINLNTNKIGKIKDIFINTHDSILYYIIYDDKTNDYLSNLDLDYYKSRNIDII